MNWLELCRDPNALSHLYSTPPPLDRFEVLDVSLMKYGPSMHLCGVLRVPPDKLLTSNQTPVGVNLFLVFWYLRELLIDGQPQNQAVGSLSLVRRDDNRVGFEFRSESMICKGTAETVEVQGASPHLESAVRVRGPTLFSYRNVWNTCLLFARSKGFSLRLTGDPDDHGSWSGCRWRASKDDGTNLTADNPVELAGLVALYEHHHPTKDRDYWWRIDGPDVLTELRDEWAASYFGPKARDAGVEPGPASGPNPWATCAIQPREQAYLELLAHGLVLLRNCAFTGNTELCEIEADHLHNIPTLLHEENEHRHEYYIRGERGLYLQRLRKLGLTDYLERVAIYYSEPWRVLASAAGVRLPAWDQEAGPP